MVDKKKVDYKPRTAADVAAGSDEVTAESWQLAADEGVVAPAYVDYEEALKNYESRSDVEPLEARRARESGVAFSDAGFRRDRNVAEAGLLVSDAVEGGAGVGETKGADTKGKNPKKD